MMITGLQANAAKQENNDEIVTIKNDDDNLSILNEANAKGKLNKEKYIVKELKEMRTSNSKHYLMSDGTYKATLFMDNVSYEDENGEFQDIKLQLIDEAEIDSVNVPFSKASSMELNKFLKTSKEKQKFRVTNQEASTYYRALQVPFNVKIPKNVKDGYSIGDSQTELTFVPIDVNSVTASVYSANTLNYANAWLDTDVSLTLTDKGIKETIVLKSPNAPSNFTFKVVGNLSDEFRSNNLSIAPAWLIDKNGVERDVEQNIIHENGLQYLSISANTQGLEFPIKIDPTVNVLTPTQNVSVSNSGGVGNNQLQVFTNYSRVINSYIQFDVSSIPTNSIISNATMSLTQLGSNHLGNTSTVRIYRVKQAWSDSMQWSTQPQTESQMVTSLQFPTMVYSSTQRQFDVTSAVSAWVSGTLNYGLKLTPGDPEFEGIVGFYEMGGPSSYVPTLTVNYNVIPSKPKVLLPNGSEDIDTLYNISWNASTDADTVQSLLKYQIQLSQNGGSSWVDLLELSSAAQTNLNYDFSQYANSTNNKVRVRAYDGFIYGPWDESDAPFTIKHNQSPTAPTNLAPGSTSSASPSLTATTTPTLSWSFSDPDAGDEQLQYKVTIYQGSTLIQDSGWISSSTTYYTVPTNVLSRNSTYNWQVQTKDGSGAASSASTKRYIKINSLPTASITAYSDGEEIPDNVLTFTWTYADSNNQAQSHYQIQGTQDNWATIAYNSGVLNGDATSFVTPPLGSGTWSFKVLVKDGSEWSNAAYRTNMVLPNAFEPNDNETTAFPILYDQNYESLIASDTDVDFYTYTASTSGVDRVMLSVPTNENYDISVYDSAMNLIASGIRGISQGENVLFDVVNGETYFIKVVGESESFNATESYNLALSALSLAVQTTYQYDANGNMIGKSTSQPD